MSKSWRILFVLLLVGAAYALRAPWLERDIWSLDEGSTFTMAEQVLHGGVIYRDAADNRSPLVPYLKAAVFAVCGDWNAHAVHVTLALMLGACAVLLWQTARRLGDENTGTTGALFFTLLCFLLPGKEDALAAHTEWFVIIFSVLGYWLFVRAQSRPAFWQGVPVGLAFGLATLSKQPGVLDLGVTFVLCALLAISAPPRLGALLRLVAGELAGWTAVMGVTVLYFAGHGALRDLAYYGWIYNTKIYVPEVPLGQRIWGVRIPFLLAASQTSVVLVAGLAGAGLLLRHIWRGLRRQPVETPLLAWLILGWTAAGLVSTALGGREATHYSIQVIPGLSLACGWATARLLDLVQVWRETHRWRRRGLILLLTAAVALAGLELGRREGQLTKGDGFLQEFGGDVQRFTQPQDRILVWGYFPEIYFFSQRLPSTRFIYTNYLTGMIAWTNLDPLVDTHYAIVPHAWEDFWADYRRHPPAVIVDTGTGRGYLKYPLSGQPELWQTVTHDFARVLELNGQRIYRRLAPPGSETVPAGATQSNEIILSTSVTRHGEPIPVLTVAAPTGAVEIVLYQGDHPYRRLLHPASLPCQTEFFINRDDLWKGPTVFRAAVRDATGWRLGSPIDLAIHLQLAPKVAAGPAIEFGDERIAPIESESLEGAPRFEYVNGNRWRAHAPSRIVYPHPAGMKSLTFVYGLMEDSYQGARPGRTDGVDAMVMFDYANGGMTQLFWRHLDPAAVVRDRGPQTGHADLPATPGGRIVLLMEPGPMNDPSFDWSYWGDLRCEASSPMLRFGELRLPAQLFESGDGKPMSTDTAGRWTAQAPFRIVYSFQKGMSSLIFTYGLEERTYDPPRAEGTDGVEVAVEFKHADGRIESILNRLLDPRHVEADRGPQACFVLLPAAEAGEIQLRIGVGPQGNSLDDWAYLTAPRAQGPGPDIVWGGRILIPLESEKFGGQPLTPYDENYWGAHAPSHLVYERPPELGAVSFSYGIDPNAYGLKDRTRRTDGVDVLVQFEPANSLRKTTLFHRHLDPANNPDDRGEQHARVDLPPGVPGKLSFVMGPGPNNDNSYDWCYWAKFIGAP